VENRVYRKRGGGGKKKERKKERKKKEKGKQRGFSRCGGRSRDRDHRSVIAARLSAWPKNYRCRCRARARCDLMARSRTAKQFSRASQRLGNPASRSLVIGSDHSLDSFGRTSSRSRSLSPRASDVYQPAPARLSETVPGVISHGASRPELAARLTIADERNALAPGVSRSADRASSVILARVSHRRTSASAP